MAHQTLRIHRFADTWLPFFYVFNAFYALQALPLLQVFYDSLFFDSFPSFHCFQCLPCAIGLHGFPCFQCFPLMAFPGSVAWARLTAFPEVRFMRCVVHGSNLHRMRVPAELSDKPTPTESEYDRALAPAEF